MARLFLLLVPVIAATLRTASGRAFGADFHLQRDQDHGHPKEWGRRWIDGLPEPVTKYILAVPRLRLLFCFVPKNACTQFARMINALNGIEERANSTCPSTNFFASSVRNLMNSRLQEAGQFRMDVMKSQDWTKAVFLRDPLDRVVSAHRSKCYPRHECGGCPGENFSEMVLENLSDTSNDHFLPQFNFCGTPETGGLGSTIKDYDFVGYITKNHTEVNGQVKDMLRMAWRRRKELNEERDLDLPRPQPVAVVDYFPVDHAAGPDGMHHIDEDEFSMLDYWRPDTMAKALQYYGRDYELPGLKVPSWAVGPQGLLERAPASPA
jgi:hypothetical protein